MVWYSESFWFSLCSFVGIHLISKILTTIITFENVHTYSTGTLGYLVKKKISYIFSMKLQWAWFGGLMYSVVLCRYCSSGRGRNSGQSEDHQETTKGQCVRVPGGRGANVWRETERDRERIKICRSCENTL